MNDKKDFETQKQELEEAIALRDEENSKLQEQIDMWTDKIKSQSNVQQIQNEKIAEIIKSIEDCKTKLQDIHKLIVENKWKLIKAEITVDNEESDYGVYLKKIENLKALSVDKGKEEAVPTEVLQASCAESVSSTDSIVACRNDLEAQAAEQSITIIELQENITKEEQRHGILTKRNAAALLKLRKELQQSEVKRKDIMDNYKRRDNMVTQITE